ncbi:IBR domain-containing protein [Cladophialophora immunda]|nr:IBR domain-containing protein [Cladophialophora immunda]
MAENDIALLANRVICPGEQCSMLFSADQFEFLIEPDDPLFDFELYGSLWRKEQIDNALKAIPGNEVCPFCDYIQNFGNSPKHENPIFTCMGDGCGRRSCRFCGGAAHDGKTCREAKMPDLAPGVEEQTG